jgi:hypothetical protein
MFKNLGSGSLIAWKAASVGHPCQVGTEFPILGRKNKKLKKFAFVVL